MLMNAMGKRTIVARFAREIDDHGDFIMNVRDTNQMTDRYKELAAWDPPVWGHIGMRPELLGVASEDERL